MCGGGDDDNKDGGLGSYLMSFTAIEKGSRVVGKICEVCSYYLLKRSQVIEWNDPQAITYGTPLGNPQLNADLTTGNGELTYTPVLGEVLRVGEHELKVDAAETNDYNSASKTVGIRVKRATPTIQWEKPKDIMFGTALSDVQLNAKASDVLGDTIAGSYDYRINGPQGWQRIAPGKTPDAGQRTLRVSFSQTDKENFTDAKPKEVKLTIKRLPLTIVWNPPTPIAYGTYVTRNAKSDPQSTQAAYDIPGEPLSVGIHKLTVRFRTNKKQWNYVDNEKTISVTVIKATPTITWNPPQQISVGTPLTGDYLNAICNVPANSVWNPVVGTAFDAVGPQRLVVSFTPQNSQNYETAQEERAITVVLITDAEKQAAGINAATEAKILTGEVRDNDRLVGAHSRSVLASPSHQYQNLSAPAADGTQGVQVRKQKLDGTFTPYKHSTLPPAAWTDEQIMLATAEVGKTERITRRDADGASLYQSQVDGVNWEVVKRAGSVTASYPAGGGFTSVVNFQAQFQ